MGKLKPVLFRTMQWESKRHLVACLKALAKHMRSPHCAAAVFLIKFNLQVYHCVYHVVTRSQGGPQGADFCSSWKPFESLDFVLALTFGCVQKMTNIRCVSAEVWRQSNHSNYYICKLWLAAEWMMTDQQKSDQKSDSIKCQMNWQNPGCCWCRWKSN